MRMTACALLKILYSKLLIAFFIVLTVGPALASVSVLAPVNGLGARLPLKGFATFLGHVSHGSSSWSRYQPDLAVGDITFDNPAPMEGEAVTIAATIQNVGRRSSYDVRVGFYDGDPLSGGRSIGFVTIRSIRSRRSVVATSVWRAKAGTHVIYVMADVDDTSSESNESNNTNCSVIVTATVSRDSTPTQVGKWAVLIGISDYEGTESDLWNPHRDALDMYKTLVTRYGFSPGNIRMLLNGSATLDSILAAIDWLNSVEDSSDDIVVFFFSGHGARRSERDRSWHYGDGDSERDGRDEFIVSYDMWAYADGFLAKKFAAFDSNNLFLWFSSCYSGGMNDIYRIGGFSGVICTACKEDQYGFDVFQFKNTAFGEFYIDRGILQAMADTNRDKVITVEEAFYYGAPRVAAWIEDETSYRSEPQIFDSDSVNDLCP